MGGKRKRTHPATTTQPILTRGTPKQPASFCSGARKALCWFGRGNFLVQRFGPLPGYPNVLPPISEALCRVCSLHFTSPGLFPAQFGRGGDGAGVGGTAGRQGGGHHVGEGQQGGGLSTWQSLGLCPCCLQRFFVSKRRKAAGRMQRMIRTHFKKHSTVDFKAGCPDASTAIVSNIS